MLETSSLDLESIQYQILFETPLFLTIPQQSKATTDPRKQHRSVTPAAEESRPGTRILRGVGYRAPGT